jgi:hypothetical protein
MQTKHLSVWYVSSKVTMLLLGQQALHIPYNKHEYGPMNATTSLLHPVYKRLHINLWWYRYEFPDTHTQLYVHTTCQ